MPVRAVLAAATLLSIGCGGGTSGVRRVGEQQEATLKKHGQQVSTLKFNVPSMHILSVGSGGK